MYYWQAVCNEFYNRYAKDYRFHYTNMRFYPETQDDVEKKKLKRARYYFNKKKCIYLTQREADCIYHMCLGMTIRQTAEELLLSARSVEFYLKRIKEKFGIQYKNPLLKYIQAHKHYPEFFAHMEAEFNE